MDENETMNEKQTGDTTQSVLPQRLLLQQRSVLQQMIDCGFAGEEDITSLRERLSLDEDTWEGWLREGVVPGQVVRLSKGMAEMYAPWVWASLLRQTEDGSVPAMKLYFELCKGDTAGAETAGAVSSEVLRLRREIFEDKAGEGR